jgi:hypothetical protein
VWDPTVGSHTDAAGGGWVGSAITAHPRTSDRDIAGHAGISDQGQISKLLARLKGVGLIEETGHGQAKREPNAWTLIAKGDQVQREIELRAGRAGPQTIKGKAGRRCCVGSGGRGRRGGERKAGVAVRGAGVCGDLPGEVVLIEGGCRCEGGRW